MAAPSADSAAGLLDQQSSTARVDAAARDGHRGAVGPWVLAGGLGLSLVLLQLLPVGEVFDGEISSWWCVGCTFRCTPAEAAGLWSVALFYGTMVGATVLHSIAQGQNGTAGRNEAVTRRHTTAADVGGDGATVCHFLAYFFSLAAGSLLWALGGVRFVHPVQAYQVQLIGAEMLAACTALFVAVHVTMAENWSPEPEAKGRHELVTHGVFRWARHPMYAVFVWAAIGTLLATLNWLFAWCVSGLVMLTLRRIETEERILIGLFGARYLEYRERVPALGPGPWCCLGFDRGKPP